MEGLIVLGCTMVILATLAALVVYVIKYEK